LNKVGECFGINTAIAQDANGVGFSIPINSTKGILAGVLQNGKVSRAYLGVNYITITPEVSRHYKLNVTRGAYVHVDGNGSPIASGSPAAQSGLQDGDIITKINDQAIGSAGSLSSIIGQYRPGDKITLTYLRDGKEQTATITLGSYAN
jgi:S1-C subfamily serine protease